MGGGEGIHEGVDIDPELVHHASAADWREALARVVPCVIVLKVTQTRAFDTEPAGSAYATGFIVDKKRGIVLTNRHVVTPGPIVAEAIFLNREELPIYPLYYDPVHDFAFLRFDPSKLQFMEVNEVPLAPESASVGLDIRVVGNDSGEKVSILAGVLARLDRDAPQYGRKGFNDFNTFYLQAASGTKGGSSGSPVIDSKGHAVGLNAGGKNKAASAFYLPLEQVVRALALIQADKDLNSPWSEWPSPRIPRGDLQTIFVFRGFDEVRRLGLRQETEREVRESPARSHGADERPTPTGMLVVESVVPGSPADGHIEAGDVCVRVCGQIVTHFLHLEELLNNAVGEEVELELERGGAKVNAKVRVTDLHSVTPSTFLELAGGSVHALSYQQARNNRAVVGQVYVAEAGYMLGRSNIPKHAIIVSLNGKPTPDLSAFGAVLHLLPHGARVPIEYFTFSDRHRKKSSILQWDRQWYGPPVLWKRDDALGLWHPSSLCPAAVPPAAASPATLPAPSSAAMLASQDAEMKAEDAGDRLEEHLRSCLALVDVDIPLVCLTDGVHARSFAGNALVVYHSDKLGLAVTDRNTVPVGPCDVNLTFGAHPSEIPAKVRFLHPLHNFAILSYDPQALPPDARAKICAANLVPSPSLKRGNTVTLAGLTKFLRIMQRTSTVTNACSAHTINAAEVPRFRAVHEEVVKLDQDFGATFSGVLTDTEGIRALWGSYAEQVSKEEREWCAGMHTYVFHPWVQRLASLEENPQQPPPAVRVLDAELEPLLLSKASQFNLPAEWVSKLDRLDPERRQVLRVRSCVAQSHAASVLKSGDMLLAMDGKPVTCFRDVESVIAAYPTWVQPPSQPTPSFTCGLLEGSRAVTVPPSKGSADSGPGADAVGSGCTGDADTEAGLGSSNGTPAKRQKLANVASTSASQANHEGKKCVVGDPSTSGYDDAGPLTTSSSTAAEAAPMTRLTIFRGGEISDVELLLGTEDGMGTNRIVHWCGAQLQAPHRAVKEMGYLPQASGVYISRWHHGSPAHRYGLFALHFIIEVNSVPTPSMDSFLEVVRTLKDGEFVRVKLLHLETTQLKVLSLRMDLKYWPSWELRLDPLNCTWNRINISPPLA